MTSTAKRLAPATLALVAAIVVGLVAVAGWFGAVTPQRSQVESLDAKIVGEQDKLTVAQLLAGSEKNGKRETAPGLLAKAMPATVEMANVLRQVQQLASSSQVSVESFTPSTATQAEGYDAVPIDLNVAGRYASVEKFLHRLRVHAAPKDGHIHANGRLFDVRGIGLVPGGIAPPELTASIRLVTFVYTGAPPVADPTTDTATATEEAS